MTSWGDLEKALQSAMAKRDFAEADRLLDALWAEARRRDERQLECNTHFAEGLLRDAQERYEAAEEAFAAALRLDETIHGKDHTAVAEALNSIGIVRAKRGDREGALAAYRRAAEIFRAKRPFHLAGAMCSVAHQLIELGRNEEALAAFEQGVAAARAEPKTPVHDAAGAFLGAGEALRRSGRYPEAFGKLATATQLATPKMWPKLADPVARAWFTLGIVSRYGLARCQMQAAFAFWCASGPSAPPEVKARADEELASMPERVLLQGDPSKFRVVFQDEKDNVHVASSSRGLYHLRTKIDAAVGDVVDVTLEGRRVVSVRPLSN